MLFTSLQVIIPLSVQTISPLHHQIPLFQLVNPLPLLYNSQLHSPCPSFHFVIPLHTQCNFPQHSPFPSLEFCMHPSRCRPWPLPSLEYCLYPSRCRPWPPWTATCGSSASSAPPSSAGCYWRWPRRSATGGTPGTRQWDTPAVSGGKGTSGDCGRRVAVVSVVTGVAKAFSYGGVVAGVGVVTVVAGGG